MTFRIGQKVVCVRAADIDDFDKWGPLERGAIYQVRGIVDGYCAHLGRAPGIVLEEIRNPISPNGVEYNYGFARFRPLVETKSDISFTVGAPKDSEYWDNRKVKVS